METQHYSVVFYKTAKGECLALEFLESLNDYAQGKAARWIEQLRIHGPNLKRPMADVLAGPIRELRFSYGTNQYRLLYFIHERTIVVTHGFLKKAWSVDPREIDRSEKYRADWLARKAASK